MSAIHALQTEVLMPFSTESKRTHERLTAYWESLKGQRAYPAENEIEPAALNDIWDYCFLLNAGKGTPKHGFKYEYMGKELLHAYGMDMTDLERIDASTTPHIAGMVAKFVDVSNTGKPQIDDAHFTNVNNMRILYRSCLLPLGRTGGVEFILGCMRWKYE